MSEPGTSASGDSNWKPPGGRYRGIRVFAGPRKGAKNKRGPHMNEDSSTFTALIHFIRIIQLVDEGRPVLATVLWFGNTLTHEPEGPPLSLPLDDMTVCDTFLFLAVTVRHTKRSEGLLVPRWRSHSPFYSNIMKRARYFRTLHYVHFCDSNNEPEYDIMGTENSVRHFIDYFGKYFSPCEYLAMDEEIVKFKERMSFRRCIPEKCKWLGIKM
jgi:hypothetical protein